MAGLPGRKLFRLLGNQVLRQRLKPESGHLHAVDQADEVIDIHVGYSNIRFADHVPG